jgi:hypothetical protein
VVVLDEAVVVEAALVVVDAVVVVAGSSNPRNSMVSFCEVGPPLNLKIEE